MFGTFEIKTAAAIPGIRFVEAQTLTVKWPWYRFVLVHGLKIVPWLLLGMAMFLRENRNWRAWLMVLPAVAYMVALSFLSCSYNLLESLPEYVFVTVILWFLLERLIKHKYFAVAAFVMGLFLILCHMALLALSRENGGFNILIGFFAAVAIAWLLSERLSQCRPFKAIIFVVGLFLVVGVVVLLSYIAEDPSRLERPDGYDLPLKFTGLCYSLGLLIHLGGLLGARYVCRKRYSPVKFRIVLLLFHVVPVLVILFPLSYAMALEYTALSLMGLAILSPYLLLIFAMPFHRRRFLALFRLEPKKSS